MPNRPWHTPAAARLQRLLRRVQAIIAGAAVMLLVAVIQLYRYSLSFFLGRHCRFAPTCSEYALLAIKRHGPVAGTRLALQRLSRCHPWGASGFDPVPPATAGDRGNDAAGCDRRDPAR